MLQLEVQLPPLLYIHTAVAFIHHTDSPRYGFSKKPWSKAQQLHRHGRGPDNIVRTSFEVYLQSLSNGT